MGRTTEPVAGIAIGVAKAAQLPRLSAQIVYRPEDLDAIYERRLRVIESSWDKAAAYDTVITVAGYAAFFALWTGVAGELSPDVRTSTAILIGVSLLLYVGWHLLVMVTRHLHDREFVTSMQKVQKPIEAINEWDAIELKKRQSPHGGATILDASVWNCRAHRRGRSAPADLQLRCSLLRVGLFPRLGAP